MRYATHNILRVSKTFQATIEYNIPSALQDFWDFDIKILSLIYICCFIFLQCQAIVVGFLASLAAVIFGWIPDGEFNIHHVLLLCASSLVTASLASGILGKDSAFYT